MHRTFTFSAVAAVLVLAGCNTGAIDNDAERGAVGAALGAGTSAILDGNIAAGAAVGAAGGIFCDDLGVCR